MLDAQKAELEVRKEVDMLVARKRCPQRDAKTENNLRRKRRLPSDRLKP